MLTLGALGKVADLGLAIADAVNKSGNVTLQEVDDYVNGAHLGFSGWATLASSTVVAIIYSIGVYKLFRRSRLTAYRWFEWGLLVSIFVVQVFDFADRELAAFGTCLFNLILLVTIRAMINEEERRKIAVSAPPADAPAAGDASGRSSNLGGAQASGIRESSAWATASRTGSSSMRSSTSWKKPRTISRSASERDSPRAMQ